MLRIIDGICLDGHGGESWSLRGREEADTGEKREREKRREEKRREDEKQERSNMTQWLISRYEEQEQDLCYLVDIWIYGCCCCVVVVIVVKLDLMMLFRGKRV